MLQSFLVALKELHNLRALATKLHQLQYTGHLSASNLSSFFKKRTNKQTKKGLFAFLLNPLNLLEQNVV